MQDIIIGISRVIFEQIDPLTGNLLTDGERHIFDCNTSVNFDPKYVGGDEIVYENNGRVVDHNVRDISWYGADITFKTIQLPVNAFRFLYGGTIQTSVYVSPIGNEVNVRSVFKMILYCENFEGSSMIDYLKATFPFVYADPQAQIVNYSFNDDTILLHAREIYNAGISYMQLETVNELEN